MNYQKFYNEIVRWIAEVNLKAGNLGMDSQDFWDWIMQSAGDFETRYNRNKLVVKQMVMLIQWLEDIYFENKKKQESVKNG